MWSVSYIIQTRQGASYTAERSFTTFAAAYDAELFPGTVLTALGPGDRVVWSEIKERIPAQAKLTA